MSAEIRSIDELPFAFPIARDAMFPDEKPGKLSRRARKRIKLLEKSEEVLRRCLGPEETVRYVTAGSQLVTVELFTIGWLTEYINRTTLVLTNQRLLLIHTDSKRHPEMYAKTIPLDRIARVLPGMMTLKVQTGAGRLSFSGIPGFDKEQLRKLIEPVVEASQGPQHLCGRCFHAHEKRELVCVNCHEETKSPERAGRLSLLFPGLGDLYLGHRGLATLEILGALMLWGVVLMMVAAAFVAGGTDGIVALLPFVITVVAAHVFDYLVTLHQARKGMYTLDSELPTGASVVPEGYVPVRAGDLGVVYAPGAQTAPDSLPRPRKKRKRSSAVWVVVVPVLALVLLFGAVIYSTLNPQASEPTKAEMAYVTSGEDFDGWFGDLELDPDRVVRLKERYPGGSYDISYTYDVDDLYIGSTLMVEESGLDATYNMNMAITAVKAKMALEDGVTLVPAPDFYSWGDDSSYYYYDNEYGHGGIMFIARKDRYVYVLELGGLYFDDPVEFADFVARPLNAITENPPPFRSR